MKEIVVTGGLGFIGSHFVRLLVSNGYRVFLVDKQTYAADLRRLKDLAGEFELQAGDICNPKFLRNICKSYPAKIWVHFAAESHVDRSIDSGESFVKTNVLGTTTILEALQEIPEEQRPFLIHMSTDEVVGSLGQDEEPFQMGTRYDPRSPYSASKAASDHFVRAWRETHGLLSSIVNSSNNFGTWQHPEKLIPKTIYRAIKELEIPVYGDGKNRRDWIHVLDVCEALMKLVKLRCTGQDFLLGTGKDISNLEIVELICEKVDKVLKREDSSKNLIRFVDDRKGHDFRYCVDSRVARETLNWEPRRSLEEEMERLVLWSIENIEWLEEKSGD